MIFHWFAALCALLVFSSAPVSAAVLSPEATASIWSIGPGDELYAAFGHSALRITDPSAGFDRIYNFGTFDFATPNFYGKFIHGDLDYYLTAAITQEILQEYRDHNQLVVEQELNLTPMELDRLYLAMENNLQPENAAYRYDFVRDNCTTRIRDAVEKVVSIRWQTPAKTPQTLRQMVQPYVADRPAIKTGINLLFGSNTDRLVTSREAMFLPNAMELACENAVIQDEAGSRKLVRATRRLLDGPALPLPRIIWLVLATYAAALYAFCAWFRGKGWPCWLDVFLLSFSGFIGCLLAYFWLGTRHWVLQENWNLLWAWPTHLLIFLVPKRFQRPYWIAYLSAPVVGAIYWVWVHPKGFDLLSQPITFGGVYLLLLICALHWSSGSRKRPV